MRLLPTREQIRQNRWLRWLGPRLLHPRLWRFSRRGVAVGVAVGVFFGLLIPIAQIPLAAGAALALRANVPAAVGSTLVTNPLTLAPIYVFAYRIGAKLLGEAERPHAPSMPGSPAEPRNPGAAEPKSLWQTVHAIGKPLLLGLALVATAAGVAAYVLIMVAWRLKAALARWRRKRRNRPVG